MFNDINTLFVIITVMLFVSVAIDGIALYKILAEHSDSAEEYAFNGLKWSKIIMLYLLSALMLGYSFTVANVPILTIAEFILGILLLADGVLSTVVKKKHGTKK